jgi:hypothetical protein
MSTIDEASHDRSDIPIVSARKGGVHRGLESGRGKSWGRGYIKRDDARMRMM